MKPDRYRCPRCGFGTGRVERVCWDCRCKGAKAPKRREDARKPLHGVRCEACGETFGVVENFDRHRTGDFERPGRPNTRRCLTPNEMQAIGLTKNPKTGNWGRQRDPEKWPRRLGRSA